jgi:hypothetical protein
MEVAKILILKQFIDGVKKSFTPFFSNDQLLIIVIIVVVKFMGKTSRMVNIPVKRMNLNSQSSSQSELPQPHHVR